MGKNGLLALVIAQWAIWAVFLPVSLPFVIIPLYTTYLWQRKRVKAVERCEHCGQMKRHI